MNMTMNFDMTAPMFGSSTASDKRLEGNKIHDVYFKGTEYSVSKDGQYEFLVIKFDGKNGGYYTHREFGFKDAKRTPNAFGGENPSKYETYMMLTMHLIHAVAPELEQKIKNGEVAFTMKQGKDSPFKQHVMWISDLLKDYVGRETQIKLMNNKKGEAAFPAFFVSLNKAGGVYMRTNFIGNGLAFLPKELEQIAIQQSAKPTVITDESSTNSFELGGAVDHNFSAEQVDKPTNNDTEYNFNF
jgi:hypothetical protein